MKKLLAMLAAAFALAAQNAAAQERFDLGEQVDSYFGEDLAGSHVYTFASNKEAEDIIAEIMATQGLPQNFDVLSAGVPNAAALIKGDKRYILYSRHFIHDLKQRTGNEWAPASVMAHEIGHHLSGHTLQKDGSRPDIELQADYFSGAVLQKLGASLDDALAAMKTLGRAHASATHPAKHDRLNAIAAGWEESCARDSNCRGDRSALSPPEPKPEHATDSVAKCEELYDKGYALLDRPVSEETKKTTCAALNVAKSALSLMVNHADDNGITRLHKDAYNNKPGGMIVLIAAGADVNARTKKGNAPLHNAAYNGHLDAIKVLIFAEADVNVTNNISETPLHSAAYKGRAGAINLLLAAGADVNAADNNGITPLMMAARQNDLEIGFLLLEAGAEVNLRNNDGETALDIAKPGSEFAGMLWWRN